MQFFDAEPGHFGSLNLETIYPFLNALGLLTQGNQWHLILVSDATQIQQTK